MNREWWRMARLLVGGVVLTGVGFFTLAVVYFLLRS